MIKNTDDISRIREGGAHLARILERLTSLAQPGIETAFLDETARRLMQEIGGRPSFLGYKTHAHGIPFNSSVCACINEEVVHAPCHPSRTLKNGDILSLDIGMEYKERFTDMATTIAIGEINSDAKRIIDVTQKSLMVGLKNVQSGLSLNSIGKNVQIFVEKNGFHVVRSLVGHGVGYAVHEAPSVPNFDDRDARKIIMKTGMVLAIEPMVTTYSPDVVCASDEWTILPERGGLSAHFEHTIVVTDTGYEILTI